MEAFCVPTEMVDEVWSDFLPLVERVCRYGGEWKPETVKRRAQEEHAQLWGLAGDQGLVAACVTEIIDRDLHRTCNIWLCAGSYSDGARDALLGAIEDWARSVGCERVQLVGRRGWEKKMPAYRRTRIILEKRL